MIKMRLVWPDGESEIFQFDTWVEALKTINDIQDEFDLIVITNEA